MSKAIVYFLDKFVWMLLITAVTTQALQIAGVVEPPKGLEDITYNEGNEYEFGVSVGGGDVRGKRQTQGETSPLIENIFNIPIATLNAVSNLVQSTRPAFQRLRENAQRRIDAANAAAAANQQSQPATRRQRAHHKKVVATLPAESFVQADESTSKVLLNV